MADGDLKLSFSLPLAAFGGQVIVGDTVDGTVTGDEDVRTGVLVAPVSGTVGD